MKKLFSVLGLLLLAAGVFAQGADTVRKAHDNDAFSGLTGVLKPTFVVDGKVYNGNLNTLNKNDIKSITVVRTPDASLKYGKFNPNGVILIETGKPQYKFNKQEPVDTQAAVQDGVVYVVDGVVSDKKMGGITPEDIESIRVMRDGPTAGIYGAKNGVIFVTTKLGAAKIYKQRLSEISPAYKKYLDEHNNDDSALNYTIDGTACDKVQDGLSRLSSLTKEKIAKVKFSKSGTDLIITTKK